MAKVALGITGGIGAYKAVEVARRPAEARARRRRGHDAQRRRFVGPVTLEAITRHPVVTSQWKAAPNAGHRAHLAGSSVDLLLVAPATANILASSPGHRGRLPLRPLPGDDRAVLVAPAMNSNMLEHPAVRQNISTLAARESGSWSRVRLSGCGWIGKGRLAEPTRDRGGGGPAVRGNRSLVGTRVRGDGRADLRGSRPGAVHRQPSSGPHGVRPRPRGGGRGAAGDARRRAHLGRTAQEADLVRIRAPPRCTTRS